MFIALLFQTLSARLASLSLDDIERICARLEQDGQLVF